VLQLYCDGFDPSGRTFDEHRIIRTYTFIAFFSIFISFSPFLLVSLLNVLGYFYKKN
jgi:hypothetical protein